MDQPVDASRAWLHNISDLIVMGQDHVARGKLTKELPHRTITTLMRKPVVMTQARKLSYRFLAAEAYWILTGDNQVRTIEPYNKHITQFSDDGLTFFGAYGPKIWSQINYVVGKLQQDPGTRQAGLTLWRENPPATKDYPCTIAMWFQIRQGRLNMHVFMRSSDAWLGVPYDVFNFSMVAHLICCRLNKESFVEPGILYLTAASSHLYEQNFADAMSMEGAIIPNQPVTPTVFYTNETKLLETLRLLRESSSGHDLRWWEKLA